MDQTELKKTGAALRFIPPELSASRLGRGQARCGANSSANEADLIPYSAKDLKYLWIMWDEAQRRRHPGRRYRNIYIGAAGVILTGYLLHSWEEPVICRTLGDILMLAGACLGACYCWKSLRQQKRSGCKE
jgi:hypothetical protein